MTLAYRAVGWSPRKLRYDGTLLLGVVLYLLAFAGAMLVWQPEATAETLLIRAFGTGAYLLLHVVLCIGPLCRLDPRFLPLLYNRRHLGVTMFLMALVHGALSLVQFHGFGDADPFVSVLSANGELGSVAQFPFQPLGVAALVILFVMAATSHDFWLANLGAPAWKALHMLVYVAYALLVMHVTLGLLQSDTGPVLATLTGLGFVLVLGLHVAAARGERALDAAPTPGADGLLDVCALDELADGRAALVSAAGDRVAVFRDGERLCAVANACRHQNGPLGEGRILDGCITCPWHGYQYRPDDGRSPPPFTEVVPTFAVHVVAGRVRLDPRPRPPEAPARPCAIPSGGDGT
ncbi:MAG: ferric reductase-like transmembrane domain-containing protein [Planctomycetes bacterium]|nr:ferric reductase-like transmembrane domain-containing protein [Planctomycetota bacterium]